VLLPLALAFCVLPAVPIPAQERAEKLHFSYHWHMEQPVYWPDQWSFQPERYERAWESIQRTDQGAAHPSNNLREIFGKADRLASYQYRMRDCISSISWADEAGAQISYSGGLIENIASLGGANQLGYSPTWNASLTEARGWPTNGQGVPRADIVQFSFHHALLPLLNDSTIRMELDLYKQVYGETWGTQVAQSRGFFPSEMAFSTRLIPFLKEAGIEWSFVSGEKLSRACTDFPLVFGSGGMNCDPPNLADQLNPAAVDYFQRTISRGCGPATAAPFGYQPHRAFYVNPETGQSDSIIVVPCAQALGWEDGYSPTSTGALDALQAFNPPNRPMLVVFAHDGDNAWGGGYDYYMNAVPNFVGAAEGAGYRATVVQEYLKDHPVPADDYVHVEDGAWVNAEGDFGAPQFLNWNWPPVNTSGNVDVENGWAEDIRNWAVITAAQNVVDTAEQVWSGRLDTARILHPENGANAMELVWHYFLGSLNSGYMYYGTAEDMEVKPTIACNEAIQQSQSILTAGFADKTPPTIWLPQRWPWNPGSTNFGPAHGYKEVHDDGDFHIWTFAHDVSGVVSAKLMVREDVDGKNPLGDIENETYAGGTGVGQWVELAMTRRTFPAGNFFNDPSVDFFEMPQAIAEQWFAEVVDYRDAHLDYYIEAVDSKGNTSRSPIQHVWVGDGSGSSGGNDRVQLNPDPPVAGDALTVFYDASKGPLLSANQIYIHAGVNDWAQTLPQDAAMTWDATHSVWSITGRVPSGASQVDFVFRDGSNNWDNNGGADWHYAVSGGGSQTWDMDGQLDASATLVSQNNGMHLWAGIQNNELYFATDAAGLGEDRFLFVAQQPGALVVPPWAKAGRVAQWDAYLAGEADNGWVGWFETPQASGESAQGAVLEGTISVADLFGGMPNSLYLAVGSYETDNAKPLLTSKQIGITLDGDGNLDAAEWVRVH